LAAGASTTITLSIDANAESLAAGNYSDTGFFANTTTGNGDTTRAVALTVWQGPRLTLVPALEPAGWLIQVFGEPGQTITIQACADMTSWTAIHTAVLGSSGSVEYLDTDPGPDFPRFYRVEVELPQ
jgi:hypothetical protein